MVILFVYFMTNSTFNLTRADDAPVNEYVCMYVCMDSCNYARLRF